MKIGVVGLGLIGGSIFKALSSKYEMVGVSSSVKLSNVSSEYEILKDCDLVFVCTPMNVTLNVLDRLEQVLTPNTIVTDVCSLKEFVSKKKYLYKFIPSHPMAGTENSGWNSSFAELFQGSKWVITPSEEVQKKDQKKLEQVIEFLGAKILITSPEEHDQAVAFISHMPLLLAQALCENIKTNKLAQELASSGFKDTTRLALSNLQMANDIMNLNEQNIRKSLSSLEICISSLLSDNYMDKAMKIKDFRQLLY